MLRQKHVEKDYCLFALQKVKATENVHKKYQKQLLAEKVIKEDDLKRMQEHISGIMSQEFEAARDYKPEVPSI
jgi:2-oxoglutarate dehydrogenase complex dehydrogenase (E1) component-like enzyme